MLNITEYACSCLTASCGPDAFTCFNYMIETWVLASLSPLKSMMRSFKIVHLSGLSRTRNQRWEMSFGSEATLDSILVFASKGKQIPENRKSPRMTHTFLGA